MSVAVVVPVYRNAATLEALHDRLSASLVAEDWRLRLVIDGSPDGSRAVAEGLARAHPRVRVTALASNRGQHAAIVAGLEAEPDADAWIVLDADLQDPPEDIPALLRTLRTTSADGVFAGRRGTYTTPLRRLTGGLHRRALRALTGLPPDAGAYLVLDGPLRTLVLQLWHEAAATSVVAAVGATGLPLDSVPVIRQERAAGTSAWSSRARLRHGVRTVSWLLRLRASRHARQLPPVSDTP